MYSKFNYELTPDFYHSELRKHLPKGMELYNQFKEESQSELKRFIFDNEKIDGTALKDHWFSISKADVFLSHSHKDENTVKAFAGWLYNTFGLTSFIDSCSWGYCDDLLRQIDNEYCHDDESNTYNYKLRNYSTAHVHIMLSTALTEMIDNCECVIFVNTPNSISTRYEMENIKNGQKQTKSPWIYHELSMTSMLRQQPLSRKRNVLAYGMLLESANQAPEFWYGVDKYLQNMITLTDEHIKKWIKYSKCKGIQSLDALYEIVRGKG